MRFVTDENFNRKILDELCQRLPDLDVVRVQDVGLTSAPDPDVLAWAAQEGRILLTHDVQTLVNDAYERVKQGLPMPGVIRVSTTVSIGTVLYDLEVLIGAGTPEDFDNQVKHVPVR